VQQRSHHYVTVILVGMLAVVVLLWIFGPAPSAPAKTPIDTFSHVDVTVHDNTIMVTPSTVPAGLVEVTVADARSNQRSALFVDSPLGVLTFGTQLNAYQALGSYTLRSGHATGELTIAAPAMQAASDERTLHVVIRPSDFMAPGREVRREEPTEAIVTDVPEDRDWTSVAAGAKTLVLQNSTSARESCEIPSVMAARTIAPGAQIKASIALVAHPYELRCTTGTFGIWVN
jgi:hypothetical protein